MRRATRPSLPRRSEDEGDLRIALLTGPAFEDQLDALADLRITVFRDWPYLYDGDRNYERDYLAAYVRSEKAVVVGAFSGERLIGAATAAPMADHAPEFVEPFRARGMDIASLYYFGESVLLPEWRGRGIGHDFFDHRETAARAHGFRGACFCAVIRPLDHPMRPADHSPLDPFWRKRGYELIDGLIAQYPWKDLGGTGETDHPMQFWLRNL